MDADQNGLWLLLALAALLFFWRAILSIAIIGGVLAVLAHIWSDAQYSSGAKLIGSAIALAIGSWLFPKKRGDQQGNESPSEGGTRYPPMACFNCQGSGRRPCHFCSGTGEAPGSQLHSLGSYKACPHCFNGTVRCECGS
jgi:hypothetical protein